MALASREELAQRRRMLRPRSNGEDAGGDGDGGSVFPLEYLLPITAAARRDEDASRDDDGRGQADEFESLSLYRQAVPLLHPQSTAATRTIGKMLGDPKIAQRMLRRNQPTVTGAAPRANAMQRVHFHRVCEDIFTGFDPVVKRTGRLPLPRLRLLLRHYGLEIDDVAFRRWEQTLAEDCHEISLVGFVQACMVWFHEPFLIHHYAQWRDRRSATGGLVAPDFSLGKCQSAPQLLHPFDALARGHDDALAFSYEDHVRSPVRLRKTQDETSALKTQAMISATQQLRRQTKILTRLSLTKSLETAVPQSGSQSPDRSAMATAHDRLHEEKLAHHILQRCGSQAIAPSNRRQFTVAAETLAASNAPWPPNPHARRQRQLAAKKLARQQNLETAKAFSASIAMISRHVHNEELRDLREIAHERQLVAVEQRKQLRRLQHAHCQALAHEKSHQQMRDVVAMKTLAQEEAELARQFLASREQLLRFQRPQFNLSASTSTLFQQPPEILAAKATAKTMSQKKKLQLMEKEHLDHMRSIQLLDYAYDKKRAVLDASEPKADAALLDLHVDELPEAQEAALATEEVWRQIVDACAANGDLTPLIPPPNSPPAAMRYFSHRRASGGLLPPFTASTVTPHPTSKVP